MIRGLNMVLCAECGKENDDNAKYCSKCGNRLMDYNNKKNVDPTPNLRICKDCKGIVSKNADKCPHCGAKLKESSIDHFMAFIVALILVLFLIFFSSIIK